MQWYKKFNTYLLENQPLLWHTRFIQLLFTGICFNALSFAIGYLVTDLEVLKESYLGQVYETSNFVLFHAVIVLVVLAIWAIYFYRNNAFKKFYPISPFYFHKLIVLLLIGFFPLAITYIPFTYGVRLKTQQVLDESVMKKHHIALNEGSVFFPTAHSNYELNQRVYPAPFPLKNVGSWELNDYSFYYYNPQLKGIKTIEGEPYADQFLLSDTLKFTRVDDANYVFFSESDKIILPNRCESRTYIDEFFAFDSTFELHKNDLLNYSRVFTNEYGTNLQYSYKEDIAPKVHTWIQNRDEKNIKKAISSFIDVLDFYAIRNNLKGDVLYKYLAETEMRDVENIISTYVSHQADELFKLKYIEYNENFMTTMETFKPFYFDSDAMYRILENAETSTKPMPLDILLAGLFISLFLVFMFVWFEFTHPLHFLISLPIGGVILIFVGIILAFVPYRLYGNTGNFALFLVIAVSILIQSLNLMGIYGSWMNKKVAQITFNIAYVNAALLLPFTGAYITAISSRFVSGTCGEMEYLSFLDGILISPPVIFGLSLTGILLFISLARKWKAKAE